MRVQQKFDEEDTIPHTRGRKRPAGARDAEDGDVDMKDPAMSGMEILAESARRLSEEERKVDGVESRDPSPSKAGAGAGGPKYLCAFCAKTFSRPSSLRIHTYSREFNLVILSD